MRYPEGTEVIILKAIENSLPKIYVGTIKRTTKEYSKIKASTSRHPEYFILNATNEHIKPYSKEAFTKLFLIVKEMATLKLKLSTLRSELIDIFEALPEEIKK